MLSEEDKKIIMDALDYHENRTRYILDNQKESGAQFKQTLATLRAIESVKEKVSDLDVSMPGVEQYIDGERVQ